LPATASTGIVRSAIPALSTDSETPGPTQGIDPLDQPDVAMSEYSAVDATVDYPTRDPGSTPSPTEPRVEVIAGKRPRLAAETHDLLRVRLRALTLMFFIGTSLFLVRNIILLRSNRDLPTWVLHIAVDVGLGLVLALLASRRPLTMTQLRALELATFGMMTALFSTVHYRTILAGVRLGDPLRVLATVKNTILFNFLMIYGYALFIPTTARRAAAVVGAIAAMPIIVGSALRVRHAEMRGVVRRLLTPEQISDNALLMLIAALSAIYGAHLINHLRTEAFRARRLGQYRLRHLLGAGGMGEVYLAEHQLLKRPCAIKLIRPGRAGNPRALARFEREVRTTALLSHPNTIEIYDYGRTDDGTFYYVMELLRGLSLADLVKRHGPLPPGRVIYLLRQACGALREAHAANLIHRDIKPANIFAARRGGLHDVVKLLDFGLVKVTTPAPDSLELSREGTVTGSPLYMSPEQSSGEGQPDRRSDIYSLGAVAYFLLTGRPPFEGTNPLQIMIAHARDPVVPPSKHRVGVPEDLERVILHCLEKDPAARFPDVEHLEGALAACSAAGDWGPEHAARWWHEVAASTSAAPAAAS
jgi:hypothetical protein